MSILNRLGLNVNQTTETEKCDRLYYAIAENYKISSIELENIQLKEAINETISTSSEDFKGVVSKVKSGLSNIWEKILSIFEAIRKFFRSIIDKIFRRKIKKDIDKSKEVINTILKSKSSKSSTVSNTTTDNKKTTKTPLLLNVNSSIYQNPVGIYINKYFLNNHHIINNALSYFSRDVDDYCEILLEKKDSKVGLIPGVTKYLDSGSTDGDAFNIFGNSANVYRDFSRLNSSMEEIGNEMEANKDNFVKVTIDKDFTLKRIKNNTDSIGKLYENIDRKFHIIDKEIEDIIKRITRMMKSKKKNITDEKRSHVKEMMHAVEALQNIVSDGTKTTLNTLYKIVVLTRVSIATENNNESYIVK